MVLATMRDKRGDFALDQLVKHISLPGLEAQITDRTADLL